MKNTNDTSKKKLSDMALKDVFNGTFFRYGITGAFELAIILLTSIWTEWGWVKIFIVIALGIANIILIIYYANQTLNERRTVETLEVQNETFHKSAQSIGKTCQLAANKASDMIDDILNQEKNKRIWTFKQTANGCMRAIYELLKEYTHSEDFEIMYTKVLKNDIIKTIAFERQYSDADPYIFEKERNILNDKYYDSRLVKKNIHDIKVLFKKDIQEKFYKEENHDITKYNQYIVVPVICNNRKLIGLLTITCLNETTLGDNEKKVLYNVINYICPYRDVLLLAYKLERALCMSQIVMEDNENEKL